VSSAYLVPSGIQEDVVAEFHDAGEGVLEGQYTVLTEGEVNNAHDSYSMKTAPR